MRQADGQVCEKSVLDSGSKVEAPAARTTSTQVLGEAPLIARQLGAEAEANSSSAACKRQSAAADQQAALIPGVAKEVVVDDRRHPDHQHFVFDELTEAERDPHLASVRGKQARQRELRQNFGPEGVHAEPDLLSATARKVISRVYAKLNGTDFRGGREALDVEAQVERLLQEATSHENLCQCYVGWCPFW